MDVFENGAPRPMKMGLFFRRGAMMKCDSTSVSARYREESLTVRAPRVLLRTIAAGGNSATRLL